MYYTFFLNLDSEETKLFHKSLVIYLLSVIYF